MPNALRGVGAALTCLRLLLLLSAVDSRPHTWDQDRFQLEAVKKEILERLGMPAPPVVRRQLDQESIQRAQRLYQQSLSLPGSSVPPRVTIYTLRGAGGTPQLLRSQELDRDSRSLDLTGAIQPWVAGPEATLRLQLDFTANISAALATSVGETLVLEVETQENPGRVARRARGLEEECGKSDGKCCLKSLKVSFQDIGWSDWVIAPNSYYMRFCEGSCPHNYKPASMHAQIKSRVHSLSKAAPPALLVSSLFEDMLVTRCHCA
uniref:Uncharacterized protein n=1 Tax=Corvus moneduloides TaxID=1196302 RepID=A0A8U7NJP6_CORMO